MALIAGAVSGALGQTGQISDDYWTGHAFSRDGKPGRFLMHVGGFAACSGVAVARKLGGKILGARALCLGSLTEPVGRRDIGVYAEDYGILSSYSGQASGMLRVLTLAVLVADGSPVPLRQREIRRMAVISYSTPTDCMHRWGWEHEAA